MKKLKCDSCGGELVVDENKEFATCEYCHTKYKLNEDHTVTIKVDDSTKETLTSGVKTFGKVSLAIIIPIIIGSIAIFGLMGYAIYKGVSQMNVGEPNGHVTTTETNNIEEDEEFQKVKSKVKQEIDKNQIKSYNLDYEFYAGTQHKNRISVLLDKVVTNNKTNKSNLITVRYKTTSTIEPDEIVKIKQSLKDFKDDNQGLMEYEISIDYNSTGYVSIINIK